MTTTIATTDISTGADIAGPSQPTSVEVSANTFYVSQDMDSETLQQVYTSQWNMINDSALDDPKFNVGVVRQACFSAELSLKEVEAAEAIRLRSQVAAIEGTEAAQLSCDEISIKAASLKFKKDKLADQVSLLETTCSRLRDQVLGYELFKEQTEAVQDEQIKILSDKIAGLDVELIRMALHLDEEFYPCFLTTIAGRRWILGCGLRRVVMNCLQSPGYLAALGGAIGHAIDKGMQDGLTAGIC
ncbi:hypothetical protein Tco_1102387 [Tanacetum coccineum]